MNLTSVLEGRKPLKCEVCGWRSCQKSEMTKHIASVHEGDKPDIEYYISSRRKKATQIWKKGWKSQNGDLTKHITSFPNSGINKVAMVKNAFLLISLLQKNFLNCIR